MIIYGALFEIYLYLLTFEMLPSQNYLPQLDNFVF